MNTSEEVENILRLARGSAPEAWAPIVDRFGSVPETLTEQGVLMLRTIATQQEAIRLLAAKIDAL